MTTARAPTTAPVASPSPSATPSWEAITANTLQEKPEDLQFGDLVPNIDFRGIYSTLLEDWLDLEAKPIVGGTFEKLDYLKKQ